MPRAITRALDGLAIETREMAQQRLECWCRLADQRVDIGVMAAAFEVILA
jgi:hypothetical protein